MNKETKETADISVVALIMVLVFASVIFCGMIIATPFVVKWILEILVLLLFNFDISYF